LGIRALLRLALLVTASLSVACGGSEARVFFVSPQDGATVKSPVPLQFGIENYTIAPVPKEAITPEQVRSGMGHHHVGVDTDCLPPDTEIPKAQPWVHFGDGKSTIDMQLPPGPHKLTLQLGNDLHRTIDGLCSTITVTVAP
jgi:Domain of unknown function (DUF4399)